MSAVEFLLKEINPRSVACIVIGRVPEGVSIPADAWRTVLWVVDEVGAAQMPTCFSASAVTTFLVDRSNSEQLEKAVTSFVIKSPKTLPSLIITRSILAEFLPQFATAIDTALGSVAHHNAARMTRQQDALAWQRHVFGNLRGYLTRRLPDQWEGCLAGLPAFVCGAGPSFDTSAPKLALMAGQGVVFAGDSSLRALARLGVQADFAVSIDVAKEPAKCLAETCAPRRLVLTAVSPPRWSDVLPVEQQFYLSGNQLTIDWLEGQGIARTKVAVAENCGATAIELARFMGCSPIYLFGMDLALKSEGAIHRNHEAVDTTVYENSGFDPRRRFPLVPGNFAPRVPTHVIIDLRALERRLAGWPAGLVSVVTNGGARIKNTTVLLPEQFALPPVATNKHERLATLAAPTPAAADSVRTIAGKLQRFGHKLTQWAPRLRGTLATGQSGALADEFRRFFTCPEDGRLLGAYSMKLAPHLLPPITDDPNFWRATIDDVEALGHLATKTAAELD